MSLKKFALVIGALSAMSAGALAQTNALDNPSIMRPFFTDSTMKTMRPMEEMKMEVAKMDSAQKMKIAEECKNATSMHDTFCQSFNEINK